MEGPDLNDLDLQREVQVLRAHRRLSANHVAAIDPDFPGLASPPSPTFEESLDPASSASSAASTSASPPGTPETNSEPFDAHHFQDASPIFGSTHRQRYLARRQMRLAQTPPGTSQPLPKPSARAAPGPSDELWVSASIHPEVSPSEFRTFLREQAEKNVSLHPAEAVTSQDLAARYLARSASLTRRGSSLRKQVRESPRSHRKPPPAIPPSLMAAPEAPSRYVAPASPQGRARTLSAPTPPAPSPTSSPGRGAPRPAPPEPKLTPAELRAMLPQKGELPSLPPDASRQARPASPERLRRPLPDVRQAAARTEPERSESPRPLPRVPSEPEAPQRRSDEREARTLRPSEERARPPAARDRKTFGLSWFGLSKDDEDLKARRKERERAEDDAPSTPRREKETFLTNLFGKRKNHDSYDLRHRARSLFSSSSSNAVSTPVTVDTRYPLATERALYRLSHTKLSNPRRPLRQQVIISNLMFWYLSVIHSSLARPTHGPSRMERHGLGPSEYDEHVWRAKPGTGPVATHTGTLLRTVPRYGVPPTMLGVYGAPAPPPAWSMAPEAMHASGWPAWSEAPAAQAQTVDDVHVHYPTPAPSAQPAVPQPRTARGPLPPVPAVSGPRPARQSHLDQHLEQVQAQALSTQRALRHARSSPNLTGARRLRGAAPDA
ncbi:hypothetical protein MCAP1_001783 [Malassezia caprae]|uniref:Protein Zds1 C-terminal domain-containing protein n=1 Tax=Malassezia caprae TaxID=1381934 RepID=A0AAF0E6Y1_9BASI|nr:hypothetical protein MCAP1_001783 [Malassezia caprae]